MFFLFILFYRSCTCAFPSTWATLTQRSTQVSCPIAPHFRYSELISPPNGCHLKCRRSPSHKMEEDYTTVLPNFPTYFSMNNIRYSFFPFCERREKTPLYLPLCIYGPLCLNFRMPLNFSSLPCSFILHQMQSGWTAAYVIGIGNYKVSSGHLWWREEKLKRPAGPGPLALSGSSGRLGEGDRSI